MLHPLNLEDLVAATLKSLFLERLAGKKLVIIGDSLKDLDLAYTIKDELGKKDKQFIIDTITNNKVPIYSIIEGSAASAGTLISVVAKKRFISKNAFMLIHQLSSVCWGKMSEIEDEFENLQELTEKIKNIYSENTKIPKKELNKLLQHDLWLNSSKSLKYGLHVACESFALITLIRNHSISGNGFWPMFNKPTRISFSSLKHSHGQKQCIALRKSASRKAIRTSHGEPRKKNWLTI